MKKKILIFTSTGGGGHLAVSNALTEELQTEYEVKSSLIMSEVLSSFDPAQILTLGYLKGEDTYNYLIKNQWNTTINNAIKIVLPYYRLRNGMITSTMKRYLEKEKPDAIISVFHLFNRQILEVAQEMDIPFLLVPTDLDARIFLYDIKKPSYKKFKVTLPFESNSLIKNISDFDISSDHVAVTGFPIKKSFFAAKNAQSIQTDFNIPGQKPIILILMGAQGSQSLYKVAQQLTTLAYPAHIIFCLGKSIWLEENIRRLEYPKEISISCIGFTHAIADLMSVADLIISKSGSVSVCEALYSNLPMILDATHNVLAWEKFNHQFITAHQFGKSITNIKDLSATVRSLLHNHSFSTLKQNIVTFDKKQGTTGIKDVLSSML